MEHLFNDGWRFARTDADGMPAPQDYRPVSLPHDWLIGQESNLYESGDGWYQRMLYVADAQDGRRRLLRFDGVYMDCDVMVNGSIVCRNRYGYTAFDADMTHELRSGENEILVHVRFRSPCSRWYSGAGIYRDVTYTELPACHIPPDGLYVHTQPLEDEWLVHIEAEIVGEGSHPLCHRLLDNEGCRVAEGESPLHVVHPKLWSCQDPYLYTLETTFGEQVIRQRIGLRTYRFDPDTGLYVNGVHTKLHGVCLHHDLGALGAAFHEKAARRQLTLMKAMGVNALRTAHNPPAKQIMELCDEMGILVVSEIFDMWEKPKTAYDYARFFPAWEEADVARWVRRDRNHPCLLMWSIGNEIVDTHLGERGRELTRLLAEQVSAHDPAHNGVVTIGLNYLPWENAQKCVDLLKFAGYNYGEKLYAHHHRQYPDWLIYGSETGSLVQSRSIYHFPAEAPILSDEDLQCSALGNSTTSWGTQDLRRMIVEDLATPYSMGQFLWSGIDYIGEPTPYHTRSSYFGFVDTAGFPKDLYYFLQAAWQDQPVVHIGVHWDWNPGQMIDVNVMTNGAEAELLLNGRSLGRKQVSFADAALAIPCWKVPFEPGTLQARAYDANGRMMGQVCRHTPGDSRRLVLSAWDDTLIAGRGDMTFVTISAVDEQGRPVDTACDRVQVTVHNGVLLGLDNGDSTDLDGYQTDGRRLFSNRLLAIVGAPSGPGEVTIEASAPGLQSARLCLPVLPASGDGMGSKCSVEQRPAYLPLCRHDEAQRPIHARRIALTAHGSRLLTPEHPEVIFTWRVLPEQAMAQEIIWQLTDAAGIRSNCAALHLEQEHLTVKALGDGMVYLRALCCNGYPHPRVISQIELTIEGFGKANLDPYSFVAGGLYTISSGDITPGNEHGVAFARDGRSMAGFTRVDFGPDGSDEITLPIFALDSDRYDIDMYLGSPEEGAPLFARLPYQKPSRWNVYQPETYRLPRRITGVQTVCFAMDRKIHLKGFSFARQSRGFMALYAAQADHIYGDRFTRSGQSIVDIGNNVSLVFERMDFGDCRDVTLRLRGRTPLAHQPITVHIQSAGNDSVTQMVAYAGAGTAEQSFPLHVPGGICTVTFVFLPGSQFDFDSLQFTP